MQHDYPDIREYLNRDLAARHRSPTVPSDPAVLGVLEPDVARIAEQGFIVYEEVLTRAEVAAINESLAPLYGACGRTGIEGFLTRRIYSVLAKTRLCDRLVEDERVLGLLRATLAPRCLLSQLQGIQIEPGEKAQPIHTDDMIYPVRRPRPPLSAATVWALDDFTEENGATLVIPGSHQWGEHPPADDQPRVPVQMPAGSVLFLLGSLWHGAGANRSTAPRRAVSAQYCASWLRPQENLILATPTAVVRGLSPQLQGLIGYDIHPPFMGMVNGMHPRRVLEP